MEDTGSRGDEEPGDGSKERHKGKSSMGGDGDGSEGVDKNVVGVPVSSCKRKRESVQDMLNWIHVVAMDPCNPRVGSLPKSSSWDSFDDKEPWKQVLMAREELFLKRGNAWQKRQKIYPSMYDDQIGIFAENRGLDFLVQSCISLGPSYQAHVPKWTNEISESETKWIGNRVWPQENPKNQLIIEREPIGKGRNDSCGCEVPKSVECVRFHCAARQSRMQLELGSAFYQWGFDKMGEEVGSNWTVNEEKRFEDTVRLFSWGKNLWDELSRKFPNKSREDLVRYHHNVYILRRRALQNRLTTALPNTDDELEGGSAAKSKGRKSPRSPASSARKQRRN